VISALVSGRDVAEAPIKQVKMASDSQCGDA
jgi:hypothetical protein